MQEITQDHTIAQILELTPDSVIIMENAGLKCTGCNTRTDRKLKELIKDADLSAEKIEKLLVHLNKLPQQEASTLKPTKQDLTAQKIMEGNKTYHRLAGLLFTQSAFQNLHQLATKPGLQIRLTTGGCSGFKYEYDYQDAPAKDEKTYHLSDDLKIYMNDFTFQKSHGSIVEFKLGLHESGLTITNPNQKRACSCGVSIAL